MYGVSWFVYDWFLSMTRMYWGVQGDQLLTTAPPQGCSQPTTGNVLDLLQKVLGASTSNIVTREYALTAVMKLSARMPGEIGRIRTMVGSFADNMQVELQQRSAEYTLVFNQFNAMRNALLERMPVAEAKAVGTSMGAAGSAPVSGGADLLGGTEGGVASVPAVAPAGGDNLLGDLLGGDVMGGGGGAPAVPSGGGGGGLEDLLGLDLGGGGGGGSAPPPASSGGDLMDLLGGPTTGEMLSTGHG